MRRLRIERSDIGAPSIEETPHKSVLSQFLVELTRQLWVNICLSWLEPFLVGNASVGEAHNLVDRHLSLQSVQDVLPPPVLHEVVSLRTFSNQCSPPRKRDESTDSPDEICS